MFDTSFSQRPITQPKIICTRAQKFSLRGFDIECLDDCNERQEKSVINGVERHEKSFISASTTPSLNEILHLLRLILFKGHDVDYIHY